MTSIASTPEIVAVGRIFKFMFHAEGIEVRVDRIDHDRNAVKADVVMKSLRPGQAGQVRDRTNLLTLNGKNSLIRKAAASIPEIDWDHLVEVVAETVVIAIREGEPVRRLADLPVRERLSHRFWPFLVDGQPTLLFGHGGGLKSTIARYCAVHVAHGLARAEPGGVLVLDWESDEDEWRNGIGMVATGLGVPIPDNIAYRYCSQRLADDVEELERVMAEFAIELIIVDSAAYAVGGEPEKADATMQLYGALRTLRKTSLIIGHVTNENDPKRPFGSVFWVNSARSVWQTKRVQAPGADSLELGLFHRKVNAGKLLQPTGFRVTFRQAHPDHYSDGDSVTFQSVDVRDVPELAGDLPLRQQIAGALRDGARSVEWLAEQLNKPEGQIRARLGDGLKRKQFVKASNGEWGLLQQVPA